MPSAERSRGKRGEEMHESATVLERTDGMREEEAEAADSLLLYREKGHHPLAEMVTRSLKKEASSHEQEEIGRRGGEEEGEEWRHGGGCCSAP